MIGIAMFRYSSDISVVKGLKSDPNCSESMRYIPRQTKRIIKNSNFAIRVCCFVFIQTFDILLFSHRIKMTGNRKQEMKVTKCDVDCNTVKSYR